MMGNQTKNQLAFEQRKQNKVKSVGNKYNLTKPSKFVKITPSFAYIGNVDKRVNKLIKKHEQQHKKTQSISS